MKAGQYEQSAQAFASQLVTAEQSVEDLKTLHDQSIQAAGQAKQAVERNSMMLQQKIAERTKLLSQLEQAKMQEQAAASLRQMSELAAPGNTPSLEEVRDKIERRYANAIGLGRARAELGAGPDAGGAGQSRSTWRAPARLEQIRASLHGTPVAGEVTAGNTAAHAAADAADHTQKQPGTA